MQGADPVVPGPARLAAGEGLCYPEAPMFDRIKALFAAEAEAAAAPARDDDVIFAAAALLVVAARQDGLFDGAERTRIEALLTGHFGLDGDEARALVVEAEARVAELGPDPAIHAHHQGPFHAGTAHRNG